jgi:hypothetical protein
VPPKLPTTRSAGAKPATVVRGQKDDTPPAVRIPTPEELGIGKPAADAEPLDWAMVERKLDAIGATGYQMEKTADGFRFTCTLASGPVAGRGATKGEAVRNALAQLSR